ncbi:MAG: adenylyl-sulfate kinase, partial [Pseudomonadales bacterium]
NFTGIDDPYEAPSNPEVVLKSHELSLEQEVEALLKVLEQRGVI